MDPPAEVLRAAEPSEADRARPPMDQAGTIGDVTEALERLTAPEYIADLSEFDIDLVRQKRQECQDLENALSFVRRLLHGRLDIVRSELEERRAGAGPADLESIIARLPALLSEGSRSDALPRPPQDLAPDAYAESLVAQLEEQFPASALGDLPSRSVGELRSLSDALAEFESNISAGRTQLHGVIDQLQDEIIRRYQAGDASVDSLLH